MRSSLFGFALVVAVVGFASVSQANPGQVAISCTMYPQEAACKAVPGCTWSGSDCSGTVDISGALANITNTLGNLTGKLPGFNFSSFDFSHVDFNSLLNNPALSANLSANLGSLCGSKTVAECSDIESSTGFCKVDGTKCAAGSTDQLTRLSVPEFSSANFSGDYCSLVPKSLCGRQDNCQVSGEACVAKDGSPLKCLTLNNNCAACQASTGCTYRLGICYKRETGDDDSSDLSCSDADRERKCFSKSSCSLCGGESGCCWNRFAALCIPCPSGVTENATCLAAGADPFASLTDGGSNVQAESNGTIFVPNDRYIVISSTSHSDVSVVRGNARVDDGLNVNQSLSVDGSLRVNNGATIRTNGGGKLQVDNQGTVQFSQNSTLVIGGGSISGNGYVVFFPGSTLSASATTSDQQVNVNSQETVIQIANGVRVNFSDASSAGKNPVVTFNGPSIFTGGDNAVAALIDAQSRFLSPVTFQDKAVVSLTAPANFSGNVQFTGNVAVSGKSNANFVAPVNFDRNSSVVISAPAVFSSTVTVNSSSSLTIASGSGSCTNQSLFVLADADSVVVLQNSGFSFDNNCNLQRGKGIVKFSSTPGAVVVHTVKRTAYETQVQVDANSTLEVNQQVLFQDSLVVLSSSTINVKALSRVTVSNKVEFNSNSVIIFDGSGTNNSIATKDVALNGALRARVPDNAAAGTKIVIVTYTGAVSGSFASVEATTTSRKRYALEAGTWTAKSENGEVYIEKTSSNAPGSSSAQSTVPNLVAALLAMAVALVACV